MNRLILAAALLATSTASANEAQCLSRVMYAEARGASLEGTMIVGECMITRAKKQERSLCKTTGVKQSTPPRALAGFYLALADALIANPSTALSHGCDSWNRGTRPHLNGRVTRQSDGQVFYVLR
jgi:hypothetical protein